MKAFFDRLRRVAPLRLLLLGFPVLMGFGLTMAFHHEYRKGRLFAYSPLAEVGHSPGDYLASTSALGGQRCTTRLAGRNKPPTRLASRQDHTTRPRTEACLLPTMGRHITGCRG